MSRASELAERLRQKYSGAIVDLQAADELERLERVNAELVEASEAQKNEWLAWDAKRKDLERDAARYRALREADPDSGVTPMIHECNDWGRWYWLPVLGAQLDKAADALTSATKEQQK